MRGPFAWPWFGHRNRKRAGFTATGKRAHAVPAGFRFQRALRRGTGWPTLWGGAAAAALCGAASLCGAPYAAAPPDVVVPAYPAYGPVLLPLREIYAILRETGFVPLGVPRQRGFFYVIAAADRYGEQGRLVIDARTGRIIRFVPAYGAGDIYGAAPVPHGVPGRAPVVGELSEPPRPPASLPKMASRSPAVPIPRAAPPRTSDEKLVEKPLPPAPQQSAQAQTKPADAPPVTRAAPAPSSEAKPTPQIQPTRPMPSVQDLE